MHIYIPFNDWLDVMERKKTNKGFIVQQTVSYKLLFNVKLFGFGFLYFCKYLKLNENKWDESYIHSNEGELSMENSYLSWKNHWYYPMSYISPQSLHLKLKSSVNEVLFSVWFWLIDKSTFSLKNRTSLKKILRSCFFFLT